MKRALGWTKIGIILSVLWAIVGAIDANNLMLKTASRISGYTYKACIEAETDFSKCSEKRDADFNEAMHEGRFTVPFFALAPIPIAWLFVYLCVVLTRWVRRGFQG